MIRSIIYAAGIGLLGIQLSGCGGAATEDANSKGKSGKIAAGEMCDYLEGRTYFTAELGDGGRTEHGINLSHWSAKFNDGTALFMQSDFGLAGTYTCVEGEVVLTLGEAEPVTLVFDHGENDASSHMEPYSSFRFNPLSGDDKHYVAVDAPKAGRYADCKLVSGRRYTAVSSATEGGGPIPIETPFIHFSERQSVEYEITGSGQAPVQGIYDCDLGVIHLHSDERDVTPVHVSVNDKRGDSITAVRGDYEIEMVVADTDCGTQPICVVKPENLQCVTAPCPAGVHKTIMRNTCAVDLPIPYTIIHEGECGDLEGQPFYEEPQACTKEYAPVCAAVPSPQPCSTIPCPKLIHKTFGNDCMARAAQAHISEGECGERLENEVVTELTGACPTVVDPVCAKRRVPIECVTTPCPNHQYQTFNNECEAFFALAEMAFADQCGELEGAVAFDNPLVKRVDDMPSTEKTVAITEVQFDGDVLNVTLGYSGCDQQHFHLYVSTAFRESNPVQVDTAFVPMLEDDCDAALSTTFKYDLTPLKYAYQQSYQTDTGTIVLQGIGTYSF